MIKLINEHYDNNVIELWKDNNGELIAIMPDNRGYSVYFNYEDGGNDYTFGSRYSHVSSIEDAEDTIMKRRPNARRIDNTNESISCNKSNRKLTEGKLNKVRVLEEYEWAKDNYLENIPKWLDELKSCCFKIDEYLEENDNISSECLSDIVKLYNNLGSANGKSYSALEAAKRILLNIRYNQYK